MSNIKKKIEDTDLNVDRLENLAKLVVDRWDMESLVQFAQEQVFQDYQYAHPIVTGKHLNLYLQSFS